MDAQARGFPCKSESLSVALPRPSAGWIGWMMWLHRCAGVFRLLSCCEVAVALCLRRAQSPAPALFSATRDLHLQGVSDDVGWNPCKATPQLVSQKKGLGFFNIFPYRTCGLLQLFKAHSASNSSIHRSLISPCCAVPRAVVPERPNSEVDRNLETWLPRVYHAAFLY